MEDIAGTGWRAFSGFGSNVLSMRGRRTSCVRSEDGVFSTAVDSRGRIYISALNPANLIRIDDMDGNGWASFQLPGNDFFSPIAIAVDRQDRIYIVDNQKHRIIRMNDMQGTGLVTYGTFGNGVGQFNTPDSVSFDAQGRIYISDSWNFRIVRMNDMTGAGWTTLGSYGSGIGQFSLPIETAVDSLGRIYIEETANHRIVRVNSMAGDGWLSFGNNELQGRGFQFNAEKGMHVFGQGPTIPYISIFPQIAVGGTYRTSIVAINASATRVEAAVSLARSGTHACNLAGESCDVPFPVIVNGQSASSFSRTISPLGLMRLDATSDGNLSAGYARIRSNEAVHGIAMFQTFIGNLIISEAAVGLSAPADHFTIYIDNVNNAQTGYAIANPTPEGIQPPPPLPSPQTFAGGWVQLIARLRDKTGTILETTTISIPPGAHIAEFASQKFPATVSSGFEGSIEFTTGTTRTQVEAVALRYDNAAADVFTTIPVVLHVEHPSRQINLQEEIAMGLVTYLPPARTTTLYYPQVADGGSYRTNFILVNPTDLPTTVTLQFFSDDGTPMSLPIGGVARTSFAVSLNARGVARVLTDGTSSPLKAGWAQATAPQLFSGFEGLCPTGKGTVHKRHKNRHKKHKKLISSASLCAS